MSNYSFFRLFEVFPLQGGFALCGANQLVCQLGALFGVRGSGFGVRGSGFLSFLGLSTTEKIILSPEFRIPLAAQIGVSPNKYIVDHTVLCRTLAGKAQRAKIS